MLAAMFIPKTSDELTVAEAIRQGAKFGMVLCVPKNYSPEREFSATLFPPERIPAGWRRITVRVRSAHQATVDFSPCAA